MYFSFNEFQCEPQVDENDSSELLQPQQNSTSEEAQTTCNEIDTPPLKINDPVNQRDIGKFNCMNFFYLLNYSQISFPSQLIIKWIDVLDVLFMDSPIPIESPTTVPYVQHLFYKQ